MTRQDIGERLNYKGDDVFLDGKVIFSVPHRESQSEINLLGVIKEAGKIYVGSGQCCFGPISILENRAKNGEEPEYELDGLRVPNFNVYDIIPAYVDNKKTRFCNNGAILTTGYGCAGSGVRLIDTNYPKTIDVVSNEEFRGLWGDTRVQGWVMPYLRVDEQKGTITLDLLKAGYRVKAGKSRDPTLPSILLDSDAEESYVSEDIWASKDLTARLVEIGVDIEKTIEQNKGYVRISHE